MNPLILRRRRPAFSACLVALGLSALAVAPSAARADVRAYRVSVSPLVILPPETPRQPGEERTVASGDVVLRAPLGWAMTGTPEREISVEIAGARETVGAGTTLFRALDASGGDLDTLPAKSPIYCGEERVNAVQAAASAMTLGLSNLATRLSRTIRFCFVDSDSDGALDRAFLVGTKRDEDRRMVEIAPTPFREALNRPLGEGDYVEVTYRQGGLLGHANLDLNVVRAGVRQPLQTMLTGGGGTIVQTGARARIRPGRLPQPVMIGPAKLTVTHYDRETKQATIRYDRDFQLALVEFVAPPQTVYVYVPSVR